MNIVVETQQPVPTTAPTSAIPEPVYSGLVAEGGKQSGLPTWWNRWTRLGLTVIAGSMAAGLILYGFNRWQGKGVLKQRVPMDVIARARLSGDNRYSFRYAMLTVLDERGKKVYDGNVLTLFRRPNDYVGVTPDGFELWDINTIFSAQTHKAHPLLFTRSHQNARDDIYVPYYLTSPIVRMAKEIKAYDWQNKPITMRVDKRGQFVVVRNGKTDRARAVRYLDGHGRRRVVVLNELE